VVIPCRLVNITVELTYRFDAFVCKTLSMFGVKMLSGVISFKRSIDKIDILPT